MKVSKLVFDIISELKKLYSELKNGEIIDLHSVIDDLKKWLKSDVIYVQNLKKITRTITDEVSLERLSDKTDPVNLRHKVCSARMSLSLLDIEEIYVF